MIAGSRPLYAGAIFTAIGAVGLAEASTYRLGTAFHMGPGYFPVCLSVLLMLLGVAAVVQGLMRGGPAVPLHWEWRDLVLLVVGVVLFGLLIDRVGLLAAAAGLIVPACAARLRSRPLEMVLVWGVLSAFCGFIFIELFDLPFRWL